ncbi:MAG: ABC transporter substrate-binding protein [Actinomycetota bacterium]
MRRWTATIAGAALVAAAACGGASDDADSASTDAAAATTTSVENAQVESTNPPVSAPAEPAPTTTAATVDTAAPAADAESATRIITDAIGEVEVPTNPQRIVVLDPGEILPTFLELGAPVVAANTPTEDFETTVVPADDLAALTSVGFPEANFELIAATQPDLIISYFFEGDETSELREIAPVVEIERDLNDWRLSTRRAADAIGMADKYDAILAEHDARVESLADQLGERVNDEISIVRALGGFVRMHTRFHFAGQVIESIGFQQPATHQTEDPAERYIQISLEELGQIDGDSLFLFGRGLDDEAIAAAVEEVRSNPLYDTLEVAQADRVFVVDTLAWQQGGVRAADIIVDDIAAAYGVDLP